VTHRQLLEIFADSKANFPKQDFSFICCMHTSLSEEKSGMPAQLDCAKHVVLANTKTKKRRQKKDCIAPGVFMLARCAD
jgi:hypothetical protein